jgi:acetolactate synthase-1/3 small subunit
LFEPVEACAARYRQSWVVPRKRTFRPFKGRKVFYLAITIYKVGAVVPARFLNLSLLLSNNQQEGGRKMKHILGVLVANQPGVLSKVAGLFSRRGFNIDSLTVGVTEDPNVSRMTIVVEGDESVIEQVSKQLNKLIDVIKVADIAENSVARELALIKVGATPGNRNEIIQIVNVFRAQVVDISKDSMIIEITGDEKKVNALQEMLKDFGIKEMVRTGVIAVDRGNKLIKDEKLQYEEE